jgi:hypothetical protein
MMRLLNLPIDLEAVHDRPVLTIYAPVDPSVRDVRTHVDRLKAALQDAEGQLEQRGVGKDERKAMLEAAYEQIKTLDLRTHRDPGLVLFATGPQAFIVPLPRPVPEAVMVGRRFYITPLLPLLNSAQAFRLLAVSAGRVRLLECDQFGHRDTTPAELQTSEKDVEAETNFEPSPQLSTAARPAAGTTTGTVQSHTYEGVDEVRKAELLEFLHRVAARVEQVLKNDPRPLVLAAEPEIAGHLRKFLASHHVVDETLIVNPHGLADADLVQRARALLPDPEDTALADALDRVNARLGSDGAKVAVKLEDIVSAAHDGRIDTVVVAADETVWGHFNPSDHSVVAHGSPVAEDDELLNDVALLTLEKGGRALSTSRSALPRQVLAAALLRY